MFCTSNIGFIYFTCVQNELSSALYYVCVLCIRYLFSTLESCKTDRYSCSTFMHIAHAHDNCLIPSMDRG